MKTKFSVLAVAALLTASIATAASATIAPAEKANWVEFAEQTDPKDGTTYTEITNSLVYAHTIDGLSTPPNILLDATLFLRHRGNRSNNGEVWFIYENTIAKQIGLLSDSTPKNGWFEDNWELETEVLDLMDNGKPWQLEIKLSDTSTGTDKLQLDYSNLLVHYDTVPVPVPGAAAVLFSGLIGLAGIHRRK